MNTNFYQNYFLIAITDINAWVGMPLLHWYNVGLHWRKPTDCQNNLWNISHSSRIKIKIPNDILKSKRAHAFVIANLLRLSGASYCDSLRTKVQPWNMIVENYDGFNSYVMLFFHLTPSLNNEKECMCM